jgi:HAD superfamily hydrolase (TIGR01509 family)
VNHLEGVFFDMDGVLIDSEPMHAANWIETLKNHNIYVDPSWFNVFIGVPDNIVAEEIVRTFDIEISPLMLLEEKREKYVQYIETNLLSMPELYKAIHSIKKYKLGLVTASDKSEADFISQKVGVHKLFDIVVGGDEVLFNKPYPDIYLKATHDLDIEPNKAIAIEDSIFGIQSAKDAGLFVIGISNSSDHTHLNDADYVCRHVFEAILFIKTINQKYA